MSYHELYEKYLSHITSEADISIEHRFPTSFTFVRDSVGAGTLSQ